MSWHLNCSSVKNVAIYSLLELFIFQRHACVCRGTPLEIFVFFPYFLILHVTHSAHSLWSSLACQYSLLSLPLRMHTVCNKKPVSVCNKLTWLTFADSKRCEKGTLALEQALSKQPHFKGVLAHRTGAVWRAWQAQVHDSHPEQYSRRIPWSRCWGIFCWCTLSQAPWPCLSDRRVWAWGLHMSVAKRNKHNQTECNWQHAV